MKHTIGQVIGGLFLVISTSSHAIDHSMHGGTGGGSNGGMACVKAQFSQFEPGHLATVPPESPFSFLVFNVHKAEQIDVTIKSQSVPLTVEPKGDFFHVVGTLPSDLRDTTARINVKAVAKNEKCTSETGWLVTISQ
ncbi:MAG TPA: hypothetical protein DF614_00310 [Methylococcaceae bacterium]|nr:hypothetical protein [Methylococcaceae bacterium]